jgi:hypothetical protein
MAQANLSNDPLVGRNTTLTSVDTTNRSAISWAAILLGAVAAAAL